MSEAKHTPAPWSAVHSNPGEGLDVWLIVAGRDGLGSFVGGLPRERREANARLAAASPDLLEALRFIMAFYEPGQRHLDTEAWKIAEADARAAIAKATEVAS